MKITKFFTSLGAPLTNPQWSWGSRREEDGAVFLRVWNDETKTENGAEWIIVADQAVRDKLGYPERIKHLDQIQSGAPCFLVLLEAVDPPSEPGPRKIRSFNDKFLAVGGEIRIEGAKTWIRIVGHKMTAEVRLPQKTL